MMQIKKTKFTLVTLVLMNIFAIAVFSSLFLFAKNLNEDASVKGDEITNDIKKEESISLMKKDIGFSKNSDEELSSYIIGKDDSDVADFVKVIENFVASSTLVLNVSSIAYEDSAPLAQVNGQLVRIRLNITGKWDNVNTFIKFLENYPFKITIINLSLNSSGEGKKTTWSADIDFSAVKFKN